MYHMYMNSDNSPNLIDASAVYSSSVVIIFTLDFVCVTLSKQLNFPLMLQRSLTSDVTSVKFEICKHFE